MSIIITSEGGGSPGNSMVKTSPAYAGDTGSGRSPGVGNGNALQDSRLENSKGRGAWWATVHGAAKSWTQMSTHILRVLNCLPDSAVYGETVPGRGGWPSL